VYRGTNLYFLLSRFSLPIKLEALQKTLGGFMSWNWLHKILWITFGSVLLIGSALSAADRAKLSDKDVTDAYQYYLGRLLVLRQEHLDFKKAGLEWNKMVHRDVGGVDWANPNLDVTYSEAWIGIDKNTCTVLEVPEIKGRYYTIQTLNGWGETTSNVNERYYPKHAFGRFAYCLKDSKVQLDPNIQIIELPNEKSRILARIELGANAADAVALQKQMNLASTGNPVIQPAVSIPIFTNKEFPGISAFDNATEVLKSERYINHGMTGVQAQVRSLEAAAKTNQRMALDQTIHAKAIPDFMKMLGSAGTTKNGWNRPNVIGNYGADYKTRSLVNLAGIWANNNKEAVYFTMRHDERGAPLSGSAIYTMTFPKDKLPQTLTRYFWSVIVVDSEQFRVTANTLKRYNLNNHSGLKNNADGSLTIVFGNKLPVGFPQSNWLPTPAGKDFNLTMRYYGPVPEVESGRYFPPALIKKTELLTKLDEK
jgi:hypothetical protein